MNTLIKAIILSLSSALVATPVIATPQEHHSQQHGQQQHTAQHQAKDSIKAPQHSIKKNRTPFARLAARSQSTDPIPRQQL